MSKETLAIADCVRLLIGLLNREAEAISRRDFKAIIAMTEQKTMLCRALEAGIEIPRTELTGAERKDLDRLGTLADKNAAQLRALVDAAAKARMRILRISSAAREVGAYGPQGIALKLRLADKQRSV